MFNPKFLVAATVAIAAVGAFAQPSTATPRIDQREANQQQRIDQGVASGQLTKREASRLDQQQAGIARTEARAKSDGIVTAAERRHVVQKQKRASRAIRHQKHDAQVVTRP